MADKKLEKLQSSLNSKNKHLLQYERLLVRLVSILNKHQINLDCCQKNLKKLVKSKVRTVSIKEYIKYKKLITFSKDGIRDTNVKIAKYQELLAKTKSEIEEVKKTLDSLVNYNIKIIEFKKVV